MRKSQTSIEYLLLIGAALVFVVVVSLTTRNVLLPTGENIEEKHDQISTAQASLLASPSSLPIPTYPEGTCPFGGACANFTTYCSGTFQCNSHTCDAFGKCSVETPPPGNNGCLTCIQTYTNDTGCAPGDPLVESCTTSCGSCSAATGLCTSCTPSNCDAVCQSYIEPPSLSITNLQALSEFPNNATVNWSTNLAADSRLTVTNMYTGDELTFYDASPVTFRQFGVTGLKPNTNYYALAKSIVPVSLLEDTKGTQFTTPDFYVYDVKVNTITETSANITWKTNFLAVAVVSSFGRADYGPSPLYGSYRIAMPALGTSFYANLTGLACGNTYHYRVRSSYRWDPWNIYDFSPDATFRTADCPLVPMDLIISNVSAYNITTDSATINWTADLNEAGNPTPAWVFNNVLKYGTSDTLGSQKTAGLVYYKPVFQLGSLAPDTVYYFNVSSSNNTIIGLLTKEVGVFSFKTKGVLNLQCFNLSVTSFATSATVRWNTNALADINLVKYGLTDSLGQQQSEPPGSYMQHVVQLTGLTPNTPYRYNVSSTNSSVPAAAECGTQTFSTLSNPLIANVTCKTLFNSTGNGGFENYDMNAWWDTNFLATSRITATDQISTKTKFDPAPIKNHYQQMRVVFKSGSSFPYEIKSCFDALETNCVTYSGSCAIGAKCNIGGTEYDNGEPSPSNPCIVCDTSVSTSSWTLLPNGASCGSSSGCTLTGYKCGIYSAYDVINKIESCTSATTCQSGICTAGPSQKLTLVHTCPLTPIPPDFKCVEDYGVLDPGNEVCCRFDGTGVCYGPSFTPIAP